MRSASIKGLIAGFVARNHTAPQIAAVIIPALGVCARVKGGQITKIRTLPRIQRRTQIGGRMA